MMDEYEWLRLSRYLAGEGEDDERRETERWIASAPARAELVNRLRLGWERAGIPDESFDVGEAWGEVVRRKTVRSGAFAARSPVVQQAPRPFFEQIDRLRVRRRWPAAVAAAMILAIGVGLAWRASRLDRGISVVAAGAERTVTTRPGQIADVYLSDGTHVRLGAASTLRFLTKFGGARRVSLEGEGYFDVVHDSEHEFTVQTAEAVARDVGTRFNVRSYGGAGTEIVVAEGAVALKPSPPAARTVSDSALLTRSDLGRVGPAGELTVMHRVNVDDYLAWMDGHLVFADTPLREVLPRLSRWYGVDLMVGDSLLAGARVTATLEAASLPDALRRLAAVLDARVERHGESGRNIVLYPMRSTR